MSSKRFCSIIAGLLFSFFYLQGQEIVRGTVVDNLTGEAVIGANVIIAGTNAGTSTEWDGSFQIRVDSIPVTLEIRYTGYDPVTIVVTDPGEKVIVRIETNPIIIEGVE